MIDYELTAKLGEKHKCSRNGHSAECTQLRDSTLNSMEYILPEGICTERRDSSLKRGVVQQWIESVYDCLMMRVAWR